MTRKKWTKVWLIAIYVPSCISEQILIFENNYMNEITLLTLTEEVISTMLLWLVVFALFCFIFKFDSICPQA